MYHVDKHVCMFKCFKDAFETSAWRNGTECLEKWNGIFVELKENVCICDSTAFGFSRSIEGSIKYMLCPNYSDHEFNILFIN